MKPPTVKRNNTPDYSSNSSINSNSFDFYQLKQQLNRMKPNINKNNPQMIKPSNKIQITPLGINREWVIYENVRLGNMNVQGRVISKNTRRTVLSSDPNETAPRGQGSLNSRNKGRTMTLQERLLTRQLHKLKSPFMTLHHSSPHTLNEVKVANMIISPINGFFHTNPTWKYHGNSRKTKYELYIPINVVEKSAMQSMAEYQPVNNTKGYSTLIMPKIKSMVINIETNGGVKKITSVYKPPTYKNRNKNLV